MAEITRVRPQLEDEVPEETPKQGRVTKELDEEPGIVRSGWARTQRPRQNSVQIPRFTVPDDGEEVLVKFLEAQPFAAYYQHWVVTDAGRRAFTCIGFNDCPICARGEKAKSVDLINLVVLGETPELKVWSMSPDPAAAVEERAIGKRTSPLDKAGLYFAISKKKGSNGFFSYSVDAAREDELKDDWGVNPLTDAQLKTFVSQKFDSSVVRVHTEQELREVAKKYFDEQ